MAETLKKINIRAIGIYLVIILAILRILIYPLHATLQEKRVLLDERKESYRLKLQVMEKQLKGQKEEKVVQKKALLPHLYDKGIQASYIQSEILEKVTRIAEGKGLNIINFEMLEPVLGKHLSEIPILVRLRGPSRGFIEALEWVEKSERVLSIRSMEISKEVTGDQLFSLTLSAFRMEK